MDRPPNQPTDEFDLLMLNLETLLADISYRNPHFIQINGDINAKSRNWSTYGTTVDSSELAVVNFLVCLLI